MSPHPRIELVAVEPEDVEDAEIVDLLPTMAVATTTVAAAKGLTATPSRARRVTAAYAPVEIAAPRPFIAVG
ncbi:MAG TPA: hypothetical protein VGM90_14455 [Kofleriaceae bacterium]